jgi:F1F0 ATPase subunit 2
MIGLMLFAAIGLVLGIVHFAALRWTIAAYLRGRRSALAWYVARLIGMALILFVVTRTGGRLALATLGGFMVARTVIVRRTSEQPEAS